jgi:hypothetical protein
MLRVERMSDLVSRHNWVNGGGYVLSNRVRKRGLRVLAKGSHIGYTDYFVGHSSASEGLKQVDLIIGGVGAVMDELTPICPVGFSDGVQEKTRLSLSSEIGRTELPRDL